MPPQHDSEPHDEKSAQRTNWLRASVLGANDGIVSVAGLVVGVAGATQSRDALLIAGLAGVVAGALSMGVGEYVSVSTQRDTERALLAKEADELAAAPERELEELTRLHEKNGLAADLAKQAALQLTAQDALRAHAQLELKLDPDRLVNPWAAALASTLSFTLGAVLPLLAIVLAPEQHRLWVTVVTVVLSLVGIGLLSAGLGGAKRPRAVVRVVAGGVMAMVITYAIGRLVGSTL